MFAINKTVSSKIASSGSRVVAATTTGSTRRAFQSKTTNTTGVANKQFLSSLATARTTSHDRAVSKAVMVQALANHQPVKPVPLDADLSLNEDLPLELEASVIIPLKPKPEEPKPLKDMVMKNMIMQDAFGNEIEVAAPEQDLGEAVLQEAKKGAQKLSEAATQKQQQQLDAKAMDQMMNHLQFSNPDSALGFVHVAELLTEREIQQLQWKLKAREKYGKGPPSCVVTDPPLPEGATKNKETTHFLEKLMHWMNIV